MSKDFSQNGTYPLGLRNNNPGNLRYVDTVKWKGQIGQNKGFVVFTNIAYGIRAFGMNIKTSISRGNDTITKLINVYAPPSENNTNAYIQSVAAITGFSPNQTLSTDASTLSKLARGMFSVELGKPYVDYITDRDIAEGITMIGGTGTAIAVAGIGIFLLVLGSLYLLSQNYK